MVDRVWRIFHSDVPGAASATTPLSLLKCFVAHYGVYISFYGSPKQKFIEHEVRPGEWPPSPDALWIEQRGEGEYFGHQRFRQSALGVVEIRLAYIIYLPPFLSDLRRHGLYAKWSG